MDEVLIRYKDVEIHQQELCVLNDVNLELHKGEFVYLIGKVGSGKTSLLKTFYGELDVAAGDAEVLGYDMLHIKRKHIPQPACIHNEAAPQAGARRPHTHRKRAGDRL